MTIVRIPTPLRPYADGQKEIDVRGSTVADALANLARRYPSMATHLFDARGTLRPYISLFLNEDDVRTLRGTDTPLRPEDRLVIIPSIAGGSPPTDRPTGQASRQAPLPE